jgi:hypothetical protein
MLIDDRPNERRASPQRPLHRSLDVVAEKQHPQRRAAEGLRAEGPVLGRLVVE